jgi:hypothetical protein
MFQVRRAIHRALRAVHGEGGVVRLVFVLGLAAAAIGGAKAMQNPTWPQADADVSAAPSQSLSGAARIERDRTSRCIPVDPQHEAQCDQLRESFWQNRGNAIADLLRLRRIENPTAAEIIAAGIQLRADAGDLQTLATLAGMLRRADVRVVAVAPAPADPRQEYVELQNIGAVPRDLAGLALVRPTAGGFLPSAEFRLKGALSPGQTCRVYTWPARQTDACTGGWTNPILLSLWPRSGGLVVLRDLAADQPTQAVDRWYYHAPDEG